MKPDDSVLIVTIDEREYLRLGLLLEQTFPSARQQMISAPVNPKGVSKGDGFRRADEYIFFVMFGTATPARLPLDAAWSTSPRSAAKSRALEAGEQTTSNSGGEGPGWTSMMRRGSNAARRDRPGLFYPIYADPERAQIVEIGERLPIDVHSAPERPSVVSILPLRRDGSEGRWQIGPQELRARLEQGRVRLGRRTAYGYVVNYLPDGAFTDLQSDKWEMTGRDRDGSLIAERKGGEPPGRIAPTQWKISSHNASENGSSLLTSLVPGHGFAFPKSLYAVEDALRFFVHHKPDAVILDFFAGSGTTAHAVTRLNRQDDGARQSISVTNNEVSAAEAARLRGQGLRPGDPEWEALGVCEHVTKPRLRAAISGRTPHGASLAGTYRANDEFAIAEGLPSNVEFFRLTYEAPLRVATHRDFERIAPLLWLRAGSRGRRIDDVSAGWDVADAYGVLADLDLVDPFLEALRAEDGAQTAFIVTGEDRLFETIAHELPDHVEPVRLYESYLRNFEIATGRAAR